MTPSINTHWNQHEKWGRNFFFSQIINILKFSGFSKKKLKKSYYSVFYFELKKNKMKVSGIMDRPELGFLR